MKGPAAESDPLLSVKHRGAPTLLDLDGHHRREHERKRDDQQEQTCEYIQHIRAESPERSTPKPLAEDQPAGIEHVDAHPPSFAFQEGQKVDDVDAGQTTLEQLTHRKGTTP